MEYQLSLRLEFCMPLHFTLECLFSGLNNIFLFKKQKKKAVKIACSKAFALELYLYDTIHDWKKKKEKGWV